MTPNTFRFRTALLAAVALGLAAPALAQGPAMDGGSPPMGGGMDRMAERLKERCARTEARLAAMDKKLTADQVRDIVAGRLAESGNPNLKVGKVRPQGEGVVAVDIVTKDGALVNTREISTKTGLPPEAAQRCDRIEERLERVRERREERRAERGGRMAEAFALAGPRGPDRDLNLTAAQVKTLAEARLIVAGNPRLKVGAVKEKDRDTYTVDIVTADNSLVLQREVDRHTGRVARD
jgi:hypothetical protein